MEDYELKSQSKTFGTKVVDGAYRTMIERLKSHRNPNLFLLNYGDGGLSVRNLLVIPKYFFVPATIQERKPLSAGARRAGWIGCNILLQSIPYAGRIFLIRDGTVEIREVVLAKWQRTRFIRDQKDLNVRGWLLSVIRWIEEIGKPVFSIADLYSYQDQMRALPIPKIGIFGKKCNFLRDRGYLEFLGRGIYRLMDPQF